MRVVAALGGNALLKRGEQPDARNQIDNANLAARQLARIAEEHELVVTHGNGPQVGVLALESAADDRLQEPYPFDTLGAETQGMIGYWLLQGLQNAMSGRHVASLINQTLVKSDDPAFSNPTKFIGEVYSQEEAEKLAKERGWVVKPDGQYYRRVIASPQPQSIVEDHAIRTLVDAGVTVICGGGGGIPVVQNAQGEIEGIEAVIDKDLTASVIAKSLDADALLILTDVDGVHIDYGTPQARRIERATPTELRNLGLPSGSMGPKVEAASRFVEMTGKTAAIGRLEDAVDILAGKAGTQVHPG